MPDNLVAWVHYLLASEVDSDAADRFLEHAAVAFGNRPLHQLSRHFPEQVIRWWILEYWNGQLRKIGADPLADCFDKGELMGNFRAYVVPLVEYHQLPSNPNVPIPGNIQIA